MLERTSSYDAAIVGSPRHIFLRAIVDLSDPDRVWLPVTASPSAPWSKPEELHDRNFDAPPRYGTLEPGRFLLDGTFRPFAADHRSPEPTGYVGAALSGADALFSEPQFVQLNFSGMSVLQAFTVFFSTDPLDGVPEDFTVEVIQGSTAYFTQDVTGNHETQIQFKEFTVYDPECIRLTVTRWTLPGRRMRVVEIVPGIYEDWSADQLEGLHVTQQGQFSCLSAPYGTAEIALDNADRRFEPRRKDGIFQSIEERQGVELHLGVLLEGGGVEYKQLGLYYQAGNGWNTSDNSMVMKWSLVDILGLVADRTFLPPDPLPTTLGGWLGAVVSQLGDNFKNRYHADPNYANLPVTASGVEAVTGKKCGEIARWACMASGTWLRADNDGGRLTAEPLWNQGAKLDLDNLESYPAMRANESLAALIFRLADGEGTEFVVSGNSTSSEKTVTIVNPFLHTREQALTAARLILSQYGGNVIETTGRGNPASEIGDVDTIWLDESSATTARRMSQTFEIRDGAMRGCRSRLLQADGSYLWTEFAVIRVSGKWKAPPGVSRLRIVLGQGGQGGGHGEPGYVGWSGNLGNQLSASYGDPGQDGQGGAIWYGVIDINEEQEFDVVLGAGGAPAGAPGVPGAMGGHTAFGAYSSENGTLYPGGYTDIANGQAFARTGVEEPLPGTGDGGRGGAGGDPGEFYVKQVKREFQHPDADGSAEHPFSYKSVIVTIRPPGPGEPGKRGATGFAMVTWEKPVEV